ncbi:MAG: hypothetical protein R2788_20910 [Saprospiraceae bacterium]
MSIEKKETFMFIDGRILPFSWYKKSDEHSLLFENLDLIEKDDFMSHYYDRVNNKHILRNRVRRNEIDCLIFNDEEIAKYVYKGNLIFIITKEKGLIYYYYLQQEIVINSFISSNTISHEYQIGRSKIYLFKNQDFLLISYPTSGEAELFMSIDEAELLNEEFRRTMLKNKFRNIDKA